MRHREGSIKPYERAMLLAPARAHPLGRHTGNRARFNVKSGSLRWDAELKELASRAQREFMQTEPILHPEAHAEKTPDKPAYIIGSSGEVITYRQFEDRSRQFAQLLWSLGLRPNDHIAILASNGSRYLEVCWGAHRAGLYYTPVNWHLIPDEVAYIVDDCQAQVLVASADLAELAAEVAGRLPKVHTRLAYGGRIEGFDSYEEAAAVQPMEPLAQELEGAYMMYTSGTTGRPKGGKRALDGSPLGTGPLVQAGLAHMGRFRIDANTIYLSPGAPLYHAAPLAFSLGVIRVGGTVVIMERFDPLEALALIERHRITHSQWVPTMFVRLLRLPGDDRTRFDLSSQRVAIHAAAPCSVAVKEQMMEWWGPIIYEYYGGSEGGGVTLITPEEWLAHRGSVGRPIIGAFHIVDGEGNELPSGESGLIYVSDGVDFEYHNDPNKTRAAHNEKGWTTIGDIGYLDEEGYLYLTDRRDHMIISGGVNIYPQEAENVLITHPEVLDVAVIGVPNEEYGEEVKAVVQLAEGFTPSTDLERELIEFCQRSLAHHKCPRTVDFVRELPRAPTGKLYKRRLRDQYWTGRMSKLV